MRQYCFWQLLPLAALFALYGYTQRRAVAAMGTPVRGSGAGWLLAALPGFLLTASWSVVGYPLPVFFLLAYLLRAARLAGRKHWRRRDWFLLNMSDVNTMALHLALIGAAALSTGSAMHTLLASGSWRTLSACAVLAISIGEDLFFLGRKALPAALAAEADSLEARPFMAFLWFCTIYLLLDSFLCAAELEPLYPPLFLLGSIVVLMYFLIRFLLHINALIREEYLKDEHDRLSARLEEVQETAGTLKRLVDRDPLTGAFSRRHILERVDALIRSGQSFSLVFVDLDDLKGVNDRQGHEAGDRYLLGFAGAVGEFLREGDLLSRVGGDEFLVLLPGCGAPAAARRIQDIRAALETRRGDRPAFRFSYGVTAFSPGDGRDAEALLRDADRAMYRDKQQRR